MQKSNGIQRFGVVGVVVAGLVSGCTVTPQPFGAQELSIMASDRAARMIFKKVRNRLGIGLTFTKRWRGH